jgi:hypothetical protein
MPVKDLDLARELRAVRLANASAPRHVAAFWAWLGDLRRAEPARNPVGR